jgi:hypothetical protein
MSKRKKDPLLEALQEGKRYTWTVPEGGNLASMRNAIKHGQTLTMSPIGNPSEIQVGDLVLVKWHQGVIFHIVGEIQGEQYLIVNSLGKVNGWVSAKEILGRITNIIGPESRPSVPNMFEQLESVSHQLIEQDLPAEADIRRLQVIIDDLRWYAERIGDERWNEMPRANTWSFEQNLWQLINQAKQAIAPVPNRVLYFIDCGKKCVGLACEIIALFEYNNSH